MNDLFINEGLTEAFKMYNNSKDDQLSLEYNKFMTVVIRMLINIYGEDIIKSYTNHDELGYNSLLSKYGFNNISDFNNSFNKFYKHLKRQESKAIKKKNKYFNLVQKYLIDMMVYKNIKNPVAKNELDEFYAMLFTANSKDFYRKTEAVLLAYNPYEIEVYAKKQNIFGGV